MGNQAVAETQSGQITTINNPDQFIQQAITEKADVAVMTGLFDLKQRWEESEAKKAFNKAMAEFQRIKPDLRKGKQVKFQTQKGTTEYNFCPLDEMEKLLREPLEKCELTYRWENTSKDGRDGVKCIITHVLGHSELNTIYAPADTSGNKNSIQAIGSTTTYLQRYTLIGALGLTTSDSDDDGANSGDTPLYRLFKHNEALRANLQPVLAIKEALQTDDLLLAAQLILETPQEVMEALWVAPTKGGIFTTQEIAQLKSDRFAEAKREFMAEEQANA